MIIEYLISPLPSQKLTSILFCAIFWTGLKSRDPSFTLSWYQFLICKLRMLMVSKPLTLVYVTPVTKLVSICCSIRKPPNFSHHKSEKLLTTKKCYVRVQTTCALYVSCFSGLKNYKHKYILLYRVWQLSWYTIG